MSNLRMKKETGQAAMPLPPIRRCTFCCIRTWARMMKASLAGLREGAEVAIGEGLLAALWVGFLVAAEVATGEGLLVAR